MRTGQLELAIGLNAALEHAEEIEPSWEKRARYEIAALCMEGQRFTADSVRLVVGDPPTPNSFGAIFKVIAAEGWIERVGYAPSTRPDAHGRALAGLAGQDVTTGAPWRQKQAETADADTWRQIIKAIALDMDTMPERLILATGLSGRTAAGIMSGRYKTLAPYTAERLRMLLVCYPTRRTEWRRSHSRHS